MPKTITHHLTIFFEILHDQQLGRYNNHTKFSIYNLCPQGYTINQGQLGFQKGMFNLKIIKDNLNFYNI
jgi:hypothetical protein